MISSDATISSSKFISSTDKSGGIPPSDVDDEYLTDADEWVRLIRVDADECANP